MGKNNQFTLDLGHRSAYERDDFYVSASNQNAIHWIDAWPKWPAPALIIYGPPGSGKTHLLQVWKKKSNAREMSIADLSNLSAQPLPENFCLTMDNIQKFLDNKKNEAAFFHLYNLALEKKGHLLITAQEPPAHWNIDLPDLRSRLLAAPSAALLAPDDSLLEVLLMKAFSDRQIFVSQEVVQFILPRIERSFQALHALAEKIDRRALAEKRPVTIPLVRELLKEDL